MSLVKKNKLYKTLKNIKQTSAHHYGDSPYSIVKFIYYSLFRVNSFVLYEIDLNDSVQGLQLDEECEVFKPTIEELRALRKNQSLPREFYYDELHGVKRAYIVFCGGEIAYIHWVYMKGDPNRFLHLSDDSAELNYNTTLPKFRGKGLMKKVVQYILLDLKKQGIKKVYGVVNIDNPPALKSMEGVGFRRYSLIKTLGPFNRKVNVK